MNDEATNTTGTYDDQPNPALPADYVALIAKKDREIQRLTMTLSHATSQLGFKELMFAALHSTLSQRGVHVNPDGSIGIEAEQEYTNLSTVTDGLRATVIELSAKVNELTDALDLANQLRSNEGEHAAMLLDVQQPGVVTTMEAGAVTIDESGFLEGGKPVYVATTGRSSGSIANKPSTPQPQNAVEEEYEDE